jgi:hypothetical protein
MAKESIKKYYVCCCQKKVSIIKECYSSGTFLDYHLNTYDSSDLTTVNLSLELNLEIKLENQQWFRIKCGFLKKSFIMNSHL